MFGTRLQDALSELWDWQASWYRRSQPSVKPASQLPLCQKGVEKPQGYAWGYFYAVFWSGAAIVISYNAITAAQVQVPRLFQVTTDSDVQAWIAAALINLLLWSTFVTYASATIFLRLRHTLGLFYILFAIVGVAALFSSPRWTALWTVFFWYALNRPFLGYFRRRRAMFASRPSSSIPVVSALMCFLLVAGTGFGLAYYTGIREHTVSGEVFQGTSMATGAGIYLFKANYKTQFEFFEALAASEAGAILRSGVHHARTEVQCIEVLLALTRQYTGLSHPLDAAFYPVRSEWEEFKKNPQWLNLAPAQKSKIQELFWKTRIRENASFHDVSKQDESTFRMRLFFPELEGIGRAEPSSRDPKTVVQRLTDHLVARSDSSGKFTARVVRGTYLVVADGAGRPYTIWASPLIVDGDVRVILSSPLCPGF